MDNFSKLKPATEQADGETKMQAIERNIMSLEIGESIAYNMIERNTISNKVSRIHQDSGRKFTTRLDRVEFRVIVTRIE